MSDQTGGGVPEGWYEDPDAPTQLRWWTGGSWSEHVAPLPGAAADVAVVDVAVAEPFSPEVSFAPRGNSSQQWMSDSQHSTTGAVPYQTGALRTGWDFVPTRGSTFSVWMLAISPLVSIGTAVLGFMALIGGEQVGLAFAVLSIPAVWAITFTLLDIRSLRRMAHEQTAHWAWVLLGPIAYLIARTVVMRRYAGIGAAPLWVFIGNSVVAGLASFVLSAILLPVVLAQQAALIEGQAVTMIENALEAEFTAYSPGEAPFSVSCPADATVQPGAVFDCAALSSAGTSTIATVYMGEGGNFQYEVTGFQ